MPRATIPRPHLSQLIAVCAVHRSFAELPEDDERWHRVDESLAASLAVVHGRPIHAGDVHRDRNFEAIGPGPGIAVYGWASNDEERMARWYQVLAMAVAALHPEPGAALHWWRLHAAEGDRAERWAMAREAFYDTQMLPTGYQVGMASMLPDWPTWETL